MGSNANWGVAVNTEEAPLAHRLLTSRCAAWFLRALDLCWSVVPGFGDPFDRSVITGFFFFRDSFSWFFSLKTGHTFLFLCMFYDVFVVVVVVENWTFESNNVVTVEIGFSFFLTRQFVLFCYFIAVGCLCAEDQPEV